jgi:hypothetical protein
MINGETRDLMKEPDPIYIAYKNKYPQKEQTEHSFRKARGYFTWDVIPGADCPYGAIYCLLNP